jgi:hypothetical protein
MDQIFTRSDAWSRRICKYQALESVSTELLNLFGTPRGTFQDEQQLVDPKGAISCLLALSLGFTCFD